MSNIIGISAGFHDAAISVISPNGEILFAGHSERYSKIKNDPQLHPALVQEAMSYGYNTVAWYERPWMRNLQQWRSGQRNYGPWTVHGTLSQQLGHLYQSKAEYCFSHHLSHAAAGFQTSPFDRAAIVVIDAIDESGTQQDAQHAAQRLGCPPK